jgi:hypothetical protein
MGVSSMAAIYLCIAAASRAPVVDIHHARVLLRWLKSF